MNPYLPPGVSEECMERMAREHDAEKCEEGDGGERCSECQAEIKEALYDQAKENGLI